MTQATLAPLAAADTITDTATSRYTTKVYDAGRRISDEDIDKLKTLLQFSPSSTNAQPWHFILAGTPEGKARVAKGAEGGFAFNHAKIMSASHAVVFASRTEISNEYLEHLLDVEEADGRFAADPEALRKQIADGRAHFVNLNRDAGRLQAWTDAQTYLNIGQFMLGAAALGIDTTPMEGIDTAAIDEEFGLAEKGFHSLVVVALGYRAEDDFNAALPKSRLPLEEIITEI